MTLAMNSDCEESRVIVADALYMKADPTYATFPSCDELGLTPRRSAQVGELRCPELLAHVERSLEREPRQP